MLGDFKLFDSHFHIVDKKFPLVENNGFLPKEFTHLDYLSRMSSYDLCGGVVVSGSFQSFDQTYLIQALCNLGPSFVGITQLPSSVSDEEIIKLNGLGVRGIRFNLKRGGSERLTHLSAIAKRIHSLTGWHIELYIDSKDLQNLYSTLIALPSVSIDHLGLSQLSFPTLIRLVEKGIKVKASGFGRLDFSPQKAIQKLYKANPNALMFGTDLPSTRAPRPYTDSDYMLVIEALSEDESNAVLYKNAIDFYKPAQS